MPKYMVQMYEIDRVVYCRYGRDYIPNVAKQINLQSINPSLA